MYDTAKDLLDAFRAAPDILDGLLEGCTEEQARAARGGDEGWSIVEVMCHLRDAEERALERMRTIRDEREPFIAGYDQDAWAIERNYAGDNLRAALAAFKRFREQHIADLAKLSPEDWERAGEHQEYGHVTITSHTTHMAAHDAAHAAQIARQLRQR